MTAIKGWRHFHPNTNEIVMSTSFFQHGFGLPSCDFLRGLLHHYKIELIHLNPNLILQIAIFIHLCEAYLAVHPNIIFSWNTSPAPTSIKSLARWHPSSPASWLPHPTFENISQGLA
jgi:hypothetical protein